MSETIRVRRANVILDISPDEKQRFMVDGFSVIDPKTGKVLEAALPTDCSELQVMVNKLNAENAKLKAEIAKLKKAKTAKVE